MTAPNSLEPSTTILGPYLKCGCLSLGFLWKQLTDIEKEGKGKHSAPPMSLLVQMLWREFFYMNSYGSPNYAEMVGNPNCTQIPWGSDERLFDAWKRGETGFPFIDAIIGAAAHRGLLDPPPRPSCYRVFPHARAPPYPTSST